MPRFDLPEGDVDSTDTSMGALWRCDAEHGAGLVRFNNHETHDDYEVEVYSLDDDGEVQSATQYWGDDEIETFVAAEHTAFLSGHNLPGAGAYGVPVGQRPNCPECGAFMSLGEPAYHGQGPQPVGFTCEEYDRTNGAHEGFMTQQEAIEQGYYVTVEAYLQRRYGGGADE